MQYSLWQKHFSLYEQEYEKNVVSLVLSCEKLTEGISYRNSCVFQGPNPAKLVHK